MGKESLEKRERIRKRSEYLAAYEEGVRKHSEHFTVIVRKTGGRENRLGITVSKKVGNAVKRNRMKRLIREFFRCHKDKFSGVQDIVIIGKKFTSALTYKGVCAELEGLLISKADS